MENARSMDPRPKRRLRLIVALTAVVLLASALVYTSFSASSETRTPSDLLASAEEGESYELTGRVEPGYVRRGGELHFRVRDRKGGGASVPVRYSGTIPDPFRANREVIVEVRKEGQGFVGQRDSLVTKCPSKFTSMKEG
jgi:cytochrome c-type biogenesis protein CcmE